MSGLGTKSLRQQSRAGSRSCPSVFSDQELEVGNPLLEQELRHNVGPRLPLRSCEAADIHRKAQVITTHVFWVMCGEPSW